MFVDAFMDEDHKNSTNLITQMAVKVCFPFQLAKGSTTGNF